MPYSVNACFDDFLSHKVNLVSDRVETARTSRDNLIDNISQLCDKGELPKQYEQMILHFGSFARRTKIRPLDDIDIMFCLSGNGGFYTEIMPNSLYTIRMPDGLAIYNELTDINGNLNSRKLINRFISKLENVNDYSKAELHRNQEAVTLQLRSYEWNYDIVPCFFANEDFYLIPDGNGNWKKTDPRIDNSRMNRIDMKCKKGNNKGKDLHTFIRLMKYWKNQKWTTDVGSYMFEQMILNYADVYGMKSSWQENVSQCLDYLSRFIFYQVNDPKGMQGDLNSLDLATKNKLSASAEVDYNISVRAIIEEKVAAVMNTNHSEAIKKWNAIFGNEFKLYGMSYL